MSDAEKDDDGRDDVAALIDAAGAMTKGFDAIAAKKLFELSDLQFRYALCRLAGLNQSASAERAGYSANKAGSFAGAGHDAENSPTIQKFIKAAKGAGAGIADTVMNNEERRRTLSRIARGGDRRTAVTAVLGLERIEDRQREENPAKVSDPLDILADLASMGPMPATIANCLAEHHGLSFCSDAAWSPAELAAIAAGLSTGRPHVVSRPMFGETQAAVAGNGRSMNGPAHDAHAREGNGRPS